MKKPLVIGVILAGVLVLTGYGYQISATTPVNTAAAPFKKAVVSGRWYNSAQIERGNKLYQVNCASCHKPDTSGTPDWKKVDAQGKYPPPPLNGTAHAWHHPLSTLRRTVIEGGVPLGGNMPGFGDQFNSEQIDDILSWIQSHWSDEIYSIWNEQNAQDN